MEPMSVDELKRKFSTNEDRTNFLRESGFIWPSIPGADKKFFIQILQNKKKAIPIGQYGGVGFRFFTKSNMFTKDHILKYFINDEELKKYIPEDVNASSLPRGYLLNALFVGNKRKYAHLYQSYKAVTKERSGKKWSRYEISFPNDITKKIKDFQPITNSTKSKPFRITKNRNSNEFLEERGIGEKKEMNIPRGISNIPNFIAEMNNENENNQPGNQPVNLGNINFQNQMNQQNFDNMNQRFQIQQGNFGNNSRTMSLVGENENMNQ